MGRARPNDAARRDLLVRSTVAWEQLRTYPGPESELDGDVHLGTAAPVRDPRADAQEAKRPYDSMSPKFQSIISGD